MFQLRRLFVFSALFVTLLTACGGAPETVNVTPTVSPMVTRSPIQPTEGAFTASLSEITGGVLGRMAKEPVFFEANEGYVVQVLGQVQTQSDGRARLDFSTGSLVRLGPNTLFTLEPPEEDAQGLLIRIRLEVGRLWVVLQGGSLEVETKSGVAAVRGSYMSVSYDPDSGEAEITCLEGNCSLSTPGGSVEITAGQTAMVSGAGQPPQVGDMDDQDVQEWLNNNPEAKVVVPDLTETPVVIETPAATDVPPTSVPPLPPVGYNPPAPTEKVPPPDEPQPSATLPVPPVLTSTATVTRTQTAQPTPTGSGTPPVLFQPVVVITGATSAPVAGQLLDVYITVYPDSGGPTPTGSVWVMSGGNTLCTAFLDPLGNAICSFAADAGNISIDATYSGDSQNYGGYSTLVVLSVSKAGTTTTVQSQTPNPSLVNMAAAFTATVDNIPPGAGFPTGSVVFSDGVNSCISTFAPWTCSITFSTPGLYMVQATYSGDANFMGSVSSSVSQDILDPITQFSSVTAPTNSFLLTLGNCPQTYQVTAVDLDGVNEVRLQYSVNSTALDSNVLMTRAGNTWSITYTIPAIYPATVYWRFAALDNAVPGNQTYYGNDMAYTASWTESYWYTHDVAVNCP